MIIETGGQLTLFLMLGVVALFVSNLTSYISVSPVAIGSIELLVHLFIGRLYVHLDWWIVHVLLLLFVWLELAVVGLFQHV